MTKIILDLEQLDDLQKVKGQWKFAPGLVPGESNEGLTAQISGTPARLTDYDDSDWESCTNLRQGRSKGFTFGWYRLAITLPQKVDAMEVAGVQVWFETCSEASPTTKRLMVLMTMVKFGWMGNVTWPLACLVGAPSPVLTLRSVFW